MKWYIYGRDNDGNYLAILDHNIQNRAWNTEGTYGRNVTYENSLVYPVVQKLVEPVNGGSGWVSTLKPRLISAYEIADIVGKDGFKASTSGWFFIDSKNQVDAKSNANKSKYAWLFDNLGWSDWNCTRYGCNISNVTDSLAYWTSTIRGTTGTLIWTLDRGGGLGHYNVYESLGIRPVIEVSKTILE